MRDTDAVELQQILDRTWHDLRDHLAAAAGRSAMEEPSAATARLVAGVAARYGEVLTPASGLSGRWATFLGESIVVRALNTSDAAATINEVVVASALPGGPEVLELGEMYIVERRKAGVPLSQAWGGLSVQKREQTAAAVRSFREELAGVFVPNVDAQRARERLRALVRDVFGAELEPWAFAQVDGELRWRHGDLHAENLLVDPDTGGDLAVIDWEWARVSVEALDVARIRTVAAYQLGEQWAEIAGGSVRDETLLVAFMLQSFMAGRPAESNKLYDDLLVLATRVAAR